MTDRFEGIVCAGFTSSGDGEILVHATAPLPQPVGKDESFRRDLIALLNRHGREGGSDTPDFVLAAYLHGCLNAFDQAARARQAWYATDR